MKEARLYERLKENTVRCRACPWYCRIREGDTGKCSVRQNREGKLQLLPYGRPSAVHIDPIEKKPLFHFMPGQQILSLGTVGCNMACTFCQNWDLSQQSKELKLRLMRQKKIQNLPFAIAELGYDLPPKKAVEYCLEKEIPAIAFTYNEPSIIFEYAYDTFFLAKQHGIKTVLVSNGFASCEAIAKWAGVLDAINIDLKAFREEFYEKITFAKLQPVMDAIQHYYKLGIWIEITTLVIPGKNDSADELGDIARFIHHISPDIPWHLSAFHPDYKMQDVSRTPLKKLQQAYQIGKDAGLKYVYLGNISSPEQENTYCPTCATRLVLREGFKSQLEKNFQNGICSNCNTTIPGVWS